jgi:hypothetical protein
MNSNQNIVDLYSFTFITVGVFLSVLDVFQHRPSTLYVS